jgi:divalent metal cation (Fe/Co/Zn/Cd) transporter
MGDSVRYWIERLYPFILAVVGAVVFFISFPSMSIERFEDFNLLADRTLRINTVLLGFFLTMYGIVGTIQSRRMEFVRTSGLYGTLMSYNKAAVIAQFFSILVVLVSSFYQFYQNNLWLDRVIASLLAFVIIYSYLAAYRFTRLVLKLMVDPK